MYCLIVEEPWFETPNSQLLTLNSENKILLLVASISEKIDKVRSAYLHLISDKTGRI